MRATRLLAIALIIILSVGLMGLVGCSSSSDDADSTEESSDAEGSDSGSDDPIVGSWENTEPAYLSAVTFAADGTGTATDIDGTEAEMTWTLEDDYLEITVEVDDMTETTGGGFTWETEGEEFVWDADGTFTKAE